MMQLTVLLPSLIIILCGEVEINKLASKHESASESSSYKFFNVMLNGFRDGSPVINNIPVSYFHIYN